MKKYIIALAAFACTASAQNIYTGLYEASPSAAAAVTTLQQPASPTRPLQLLGVQLYCSVDCIVTLEAAGAASGSVSAASHASPSQTTAATALFYKGSNAAAPSLPINKYVVLGGDTKTIGFTDLTGRSMTIIGKAAGQNLTLRTGTMTGDVKFTWLWREE
jgi:hypothetical protein